MATASPVRVDASGANRQLGISWIVLCFGLALHVTDEALNGFLPIYNATAHEIWQRYGFGPPTFGFNEWLGGLIFGICALTALSPFAFRNSGAWRPVAYIFAIIMMANGVSHTVGTILGHSFQDITFPRPMPGFYSSPFMFGAALWLFLNLRHTRRRPASDF